MKNLTEIASALAKVHPELTNKKALGITRTVFALITKGLVELNPDSRDRVSVAEFGNFGVKKTAARQVRKIKTGEMVTIPENVRITFKASDALRKAVLTKEFEVEVPEKSNDAADGEPAAEKKPAEKKPAAKKNPEAEEPVADKKPEGIDVSNIPDLSDL